ncbi:MAG: heavy-metal-associated domain-containing protein [Chthonomonadales bacterium]
MHRYVMVLGLVLASAFAEADSVAVKVGHMCCGKCQAAASAGAKSAPWVEGVSIQGTTVTVSPKAGEQVELVSLMQGMRKAGFPPAEVTVSGPITVAVAHMCCGGCASDLKAKLSQSKIPGLDTASIATDVSNRTVAVKPLAGHTLNAVAVLREIEAAGFGPQSCVIASSSAQRQRTDAPRTARR